YSNPENPNELFQKLLEDLKELAEYEKSQSRDQKEEPAQDFDIRKLIREECCVEASEEQKQNMEDTMLELVKICRQKELLCTHDNVDDLIESALNSKLLSIKSQRLDKKEQEVKNIVEQPAERGNLAPILSTKKLDYSPSMVYEHSNTTPKIESDEIIKSGVEELVPILSENEVTSEYKKECDVLICEDSSTSDICDNHSNIFSDSKIDYDISVYDDDFEDIEYVEASLSDPEIVNQEEENVVQQEEEESDNSLSDNFSPEFKTFCDHSEETRSGSTTTHADNSLPEYDSFCFEIEPDQERLINVVKNDIPDESLNDPLLEEADLFLVSDNSIRPGIENFAYDSEGDIRFLEALLIDDSIPFPVNESSDDPSIPRPPPELPDDDFDFNLDSGEVISVVINTIDEPNEDESFDPGGEIIVYTKDKDVDYFSFMFVMRIFLPYIIHPEVSPLFLSTESEDTIFDPGFSPMIEVFLCWIFVPVSKIFTSFD
nr:hypothetical protein [Tanacetum cinerariifolium]